MDLTIAHVNEIPLERLRIYSLLSLAIVYNIKGIMLYTLPHISATGNDRSKTNVLRVSEDLALEVKLEQWITQRWMTDCRYYMVEVVQDLFGVWLVKRNWGGIGSRRGNSLTTPAENYEHALQLLAEVGKRRHARRYNIVEGM